jgi:hypothetical protein
VGVDVVDSGLEGGGLGLVAKQDFKDQELITEYDGMRLTSKEATALSTEARSHCRSVAGMHLVLDGRRNEVKPGMGGASWANDASYHLVHGKWVHNPTGINNAAFHVQWNRCFLRAEVDITSGKEITVGYGHDYWSSVNTSLLQKNS